MITIFILMILICILGVAYAIHNDHKCSIKYTTKHQLGITNINGEVHRLFYQDVQDGVVLGIEKFRTGETVYDIYVATDSNIEDELYRVELCNLIYKRSAKEAWRRYKVATKPGLTKST